MTIPPTPPVVPPPAAPPSGRLSPVARYLVAAILLGFAGSWGYETFEQKDPPTWVDAALVLVPLLFAVAAAVPATFTFVISTVKPLVPHFGHGDDEK